MKPNTRHNAIRLSEVLGSESGIITSITGQKKNSSRFSLFVNEVFVVGVSDSCLVNLNLQKGKKLDQDLLDQIQQYEEKWSIRNYFLRLLSRRDHATFELKQKAINKGLNATIIENVLIELDEKGYLNNAEFARKFARDKFEFNNWGAQKIRIELIKKGIAKTDISNALEGISSDDEIKKMNALFIKSRAKFFRTDPLKRRKKIFDFFLRKGFDPEIILKSMNDFINQLKI